jgi:Flp pilus assembly protein CpaB
MRWSPPTHWLRALADRQRVVAATLTGIAVLAGLHAVRPTEARLTDVLAAARPIAAGASLVAADLTIVRVPAPAVPTGALTTSDAAVGMTVAGPLARGELLTPTRHIGPGLLDAVAPGSVAAPVRVADPAAASLVRHGDRVDLLAVPADGGRSVVVAADVLVLTTMRDDRVGLDDGALVVVAATPAVAAALASAAVTHHISFVLRGD